MTIKKFDTPFYTINMVFNLVLNKHFMLEDGHCNLGLELKVHDTTLIFFYYHHAFN